MQVFIVGSGKLASELLRELSLDTPLQVCRWSSTAAQERSIVVHAGSGRELAAVCAYCRATGSVLVELATGTQLDLAAPGFPVVLCPNTNILMLKFMHMLERSGPLFAGYRMSLTESHQAEKRSTPGTAVAMAQSLGLAAEAVQSIRDREVQLRDLHIPAEHLARHAYHAITIEDGSCRVTLETRVYGASPYADGVARIVSAAAAQPLENRLYAIDEFVERGWV